MLEIWLRLGHACNSTLGKALKKNVDDRDGRVHAYV